METLIVATQPVRPPQEAVKDWFDHLTLWWRPSATGEMLTRPALPEYDLKLADALVGKMVGGEEFAKLNPQALSTGADLGAGWSREAGRSPETLRLTPDPTRRGVFTCSFTLPATWTPQDDCTLYVRTSPRYPGANAATVDAYLNGEKMLNQAKTTAPGYSTLDGGALAKVSARLKYGGNNTLVLVTGPLGFMGEVLLSRKPAPVEEQEVTGAWQVQKDTYSGLAPVELPGTLQGLFAEKRDIVIPSTWKDSRVFIDITLGDKADYDAFAINGKMVLHPVNWFKPVTYMDITPWVKFGQPNTLTLITRSATQRWAAGTLPIKRIDLQRVPAKSL